MTGPFFRGRGGAGFARKSCLLHNVIPVFHLAESFQRQEDEEAAGGSQAEGDCRLGLASTSTTSWHSEAPLAPKLQKPEEAAIAQINMSFGTVFPTFFCERLRTCRSK